MKCLLIFSLNLLAGTLKPIASATSRICIGLAPQQTPMYLTPKSNTSFAKFPISYLLHCNGSIAVGKVLPWGDGQLHPLLSGRLKNVIGFSKRIGNNRPKVAVLSATEEVLDSIQSSIEAKEITELSKKENLDADVFGPLAFDNSISKKSASIKGIKNIVAGDADVLLVPSVEAGNALVKMMIYFMGACAAGVVVGGKVPVVITSRSDEAVARLASIAAAVVALD